MARDYQIMFFFTDKEDLFEDCTPGSFRDYINIMFKEDFDIDVKKLFSSRTDRFEWEDSPEQKINASEIFEERFLGME